MRDELLECMANAIKRMKEGDYFERREPKTWHYEEKDDYCECCGSYLGKVKVKVVDEWKSFWEWFKLSEGGFGECLVHPDVEEELKRSVIEDEGIK